MLLCFRNCTTGIKATAASRIVFSRKTKGKPPNTYSTNKNPQKDHCYIENLTGWDLLSQDLNDRKPCKEMRNALHDTLSKAPKFPLRFFLY